MEGGGQGKPRRLIVVPSQGRNGAHQFVLSDLPDDLREALADYDVDGDGAQPARPSSPAPAPHCTNSAYWFHSVRWLLLSATRAGTVTVGEIAAGAHLLRKQTVKVSVARLAPRPASRGPINSLSPCRRSCRPGPSSASSRCSSCSLAPSQAWCARRHFVLSALAKGPPAPDVHSRNG